MSQDKIVINTPMAQSVDTGVTGKMDAAGDIAGPVDIRDLDRVSVYLNQTTDGGTCTLLVETSIDGTNWEQFASKAETDFPAGDNTSLRILLADANKPSLVTKFVRVRLSAFGAGGAYSAGLIGTQRKGWS